MWCALALLACALQVPTVAAQQQPDTLRDGRFTFIHQPRDARLAGSLLARAVAQDSFPGLPRPRAAVTVLVAPDRTTFRAWVGPHAAEWGAAVAFPQQSRIVLQGSRAGSDAGDPVRTLRHELAHLALNEALSVRIPRWFDEGYASWSAGEWGREELLATNLALLVRGAPSLDEVEEWFYGGAGSAQRAYALSHRAVAELASLDSERGLTLFFQYWEQTGSIDGAMRRAFGATFDDFDEYWGKRTALRYGALAAVGNLTLAVGAMAILVLPLYVIRRRRLRRRMELLRESDARAERERLRADGTGSDARTEGDASAQDGAAAPIPDASDGTGNVPRASDPGLPGSSRTTP